MNIWTESVEIDSGIWFPVWWSLNRNKLDFHWMQQTCLVQQGPLQGAGLQHGSGLQHGADLQQGLEHFGGQHFGLQGALGGGGQQGRFFEGLQQKVTHWLGCSQSGQHLFGFGHWLLQRRFVTVGQQQDLVIQIHDGLQSGADSEHERQFEIDLNIGIRCQ